jgi:hypothetical protein
MPYFHPTPKHLAQDQALKMSSVAVTGSPAHLQHHKQTYPACQQIKKVKLKEEIHVARALQQVAKGRVVVLIYCFPD